MQIILLGSLSWIFSIFVSGISIIIVILGAWIIINYFIWDILIRYSFKWLKVYKVFVHFIFYRKRYLEWAKKYEGKIEEGAND